MKWSAPYVVILAAVSPALCFASDVLVKEIAVAEGSVARELEVLTLDQVVNSRATYDQLIRDRSDIVDASSDSKVTIFFKQIKAGHAPSRLHLGQWHAFVNDVWGQLLKKSSRYEYLELALADVARNADDVVMRDYALQHLAIIATSAKGKSSQTGSTSIELLREASRWKSYSMAGTALVNLYHLGDGIEDGSLAGRALDVASDPSAQEAARASALQIGVLLKDERFLRPAAKIAQRTSIVAHRVSAIRAIAELGGPEQRTLLLQLRRRGPEIVTKIANETLISFEND